MARAGHVPEPDAWLKPALYVQNLDELVQLDHNDHDLPRVVPVGEAAAAGAGANAAVTGAGAVEKTKAATGPRESEEGGGEHSTTFVYRPSEDAAGRYNHYDAVAR